MLNAVLNTVLRSGLTNILGDARGGTRGASASAGLSAMAGQVAVPCPQPGRRFDAAWGDQPLRRTVQASPGGPSPCERRLVLDQQPKGFGNQGPARGTPQLRLISLRTIAGLGHASLATPIGAFQLEGADGGRLIGKVAGGDWTLTFSAPLKKAPELGRGVSEATNRDGFESPICLSREPIGAGA